MIELFFIIILIFSVIIHEISHGYVALYLGDDTAERAGRLTLNPVRHVDILGSIIVPLLMIFSGGPVFGWAKPVPYDPRFLKNPKKASGLIAAAGPLSNIVVALLFAGIVRLLIVFELAALNPLFFLFLNVIVQVNVALALFNMIPIPPLDGSKVLFSILPPHLHRVEAFLSRYGFFIILFLIFTNIPFLGEGIIGLYRLFVGAEASSFFFGI